MDTKKLLKALDDEKNEQLFNFTTKSFRHQNFKINEIFIFLKAFYWRT
jgi:hypothetical protein